MIHLLQTVYNASSLQDYFVTSFINVKKVWDENQQTPSANTLYLKEFLNSITYQPVEFILIIIFFLTFELLNITIAKWVKNVHFYKNRSY